MLERVIRAKVAIGMVAKQVQGRIICETKSHSPTSSDPRPKAGSSPHCTENWFTSIMPSQKMGMDTPTRASTMNT